MGAKGQKGIYIIRPSSTKEYRKKAYHDFRYLNHEKMMLYIARNSAKKVGREFNITIEDIVIPKICPYLNIPITRIIESGRIDSNPSIDRIDNSKGYLKDNVRIISNLANSMKRNATEEQLITFAKNILKIHRKKTGKLI